jgi:hypothetical protein
VIGLLLILSLLLNNVAGGVLDAIRVRRFAGFRSEPCSDVMPPSSLSVLSTNRDTEE